MVSTAIGLGKYRIPSDLRSQAEYRLVSTTVGDHVGILGVVVSSFSFWLLLFSLWDCLARQIEYGKSESEYARDGKMARYIPYR